jgi:hypothetical protein
VDEEDIIQQVRDMGWDIIEAAYENDNLDAAGSSDPCVTDNASNASSSAASVRPGRFLRTSAPSARYGSSSAK